MSLRDGTRKMSKSDESDYSRINMTDDADTIALKFRKAKTDPNPLPDPGCLDEKGEVKADAEAARPEAFNLLRSEEHTSELQSLMRNSYAVCCLKKKKIQKTQ